MRDGETPQRSRWWPVSVHSSGLWCPWLFPLVVFLVFRARDPWLRANAARAFNFQALLYPAFIVGIVLDGVVNDVTDGAAPPSTVGWVLTAANIGIAIVQGCRAARGRDVTYPVQLPILRERATIALGQATPES